MSNSRSDVNECFNVGGDEKGWCEEPGRSEKGRVALWCRVDGRMLLRFCERLVSLEGFGRSYFSEIQIGGRGF